MALVKATLKAELVVMLTAMINETNQTTSVDKFADKLATAIDNYIKTATIVSTPAQITLAAMTNSGGPVVAASNLVSTIA